MHDTDVFIDLPKRILPLLVAALLLLACLPAGGCAELRDRGADPRAMFERLDRWAQ